MTISAISTDQALLIASGIIAIGGLIFLGYYFSNKQRILRDLKKTRRKQINRIQENEYAKVIGKALNVHEPLIAPLSGRPCVYYYVHIEQKGDKHWNTLIKKAQSQDFFLEVNGEMAIIQPNHNPKNGFLVTDFETKSGFRNDASPELEAFLKAHDKKSTGFFGGNRTLRYKEGIIEIEEQVAIKGIGKWKVLKEPIEGYSFSRILYLTGSIENKLIITDLPEAMKRVDRT